MKIFAEENIPLITVKGLRAKSFDVADIRGSSEQGMPDEELWLKVQKEKRQIYFKYIFALIAAGGCVTEGTGKYYSHRTGHF